MNIKTALVKRIIVFVVGLVIIAAGIRGLYIWFIKADFENLVNTTNLIQDSLSEAAAVKDAGDMIAAKKKNLPAEYTWKKLYDRSATVAGLLGGSMVQQRLQDYKKSATIWTVKVREAAKDGKTWSEVPAAPGDFSILLRPKEAEDLVKNAMIKLAEIRQFGDFAVANKDRVAMQHISAKLLIQKHWLDGITRYQPAGILASLVTPAYAYGVEGKKVCFTTWNGKPLCSIEVQEMNTEMYNAANDYIDEKKDAEANWYKASEEVFANFEAQGVPVETMGGLINLEDKTTIKEPVILANFKNACLERGGMLGGANQIVDRIPTTERGTFCGYKNRVDNCWNYMTNSGGYYAGGDANCIHMGISAQELGFYLVGHAPPDAQNPEMPEVKQPVAAPVKKTPVTTQPQIPTVPVGAEPPQINEPVNVITIPTPAPPAPVENPYPFDGTYYVDESYSCAVNDGSTIQDTTEYDLVVSKHMVKAPWGGATGTLSGNSAVVMGNYIYMTYNVTYTINANFSQSANGNYVSGTRNWTQVSTSANIPGGHCSGTFRMTRYSNY